LYSKLQYTPYQPSPARLGSGFFADQGARLRQIHKAPKTAPIGEGQDQQCRRLRDNPSHHFADPENPLQYRDKPRL